MLIVDDVDALRRSLARILARSYACEEASTGHEALTLLRRDPKRFDLVLLDLLMPGMDGWAFRREQERDAAIAAIPVVVVTGLPADDLASRPRIDAQEILVKPFEPGALLAIVKRAIRPSKVGGS